MKLKIRHPVIDPFLDFRRIRREIVVIFGVLCINSLVFGQSLNITPTTNTGDTGKQVRVIAKRGSYTALDTSVMLGETVSANYGSVGVDDFDFNIPASSVVGLGNNVTNDGNIYPFLNGQSNNVDYRVFDITGRNVTKNSRFSTGAYFLQVFNKSSGEILGTERFLNYSGKLTVEFKETPKQHLGKISNDTDSLLVFYEGNDMQLEPFKEAISIPEGISEFPVELERTLRTPTININNTPQNPTIDTTYTLTLQTSSPDYDSGNISLGVEQINGTAPHLFNNIDTLLINPTTAGYNTFRLTATDNRGLEQTANIELDITSEKYKLLLTKLFNGLGLPREGIDATLLGYTIRTQANGIAEFEFQNGTNLNELDSIDLDDTILGNLQEGLGPFAAMRIGIKPELVNTNETHTQQTFTDEMMRQNPNYWDTYVWANQLDREFYLLALMLNDNHIIIRRGSIETGFTDMLHYSPEHHSGTGDNTADYREYTTIVFDSIRTAIENLSKDELGNGNTPLTFINVAPADSQQAINHGNVFDFSHTSSGGKYIQFEVDQETGIPYITTSAQYINKGLLYNSLLKDMFHELGRAVAYSGITPYSPEHITDVMSNGDVRPHDMAGYYTMMNVDPKLFLKIRNLRSILPASEPYWPSN